MLSNRFFCITLAGMALFGYSTDSPAWSADGHNAIAMLAIDQLQTDARDELEGIIGPLDEKVLGEACNWPDVVRETEAWEWSKPLHYINIPRGDFTYLESRDCPDQLCATQAIKRYASELADTGSSREKRWQAFAWLCHLVGDLHQPMHAGFADDRGGNEVEIIVRDESMNLHRYWDFEVINQHAGGWQGLVKLLQVSPVATAASNWSPESVNGWTDESHKLAAEKAYPSSETIDEAYKQQSREIAQQRISTAASRFALIINSVLKEGN